MQSTCPNLIFFIVKKNFFLLTRACLFQNLIGQETKQKQLQQYGKTVNEQRNFQWHHHRLKTDQRKHKHRRTELSQENSRIRLFKE